MNLKTIVIILAFLTITNCQNEAKPDISSGMIKISIMYSNTESGTFNMDYYKEKHMPMLSELFGESLKQYSIDEGVSGRLPNEPATYIAIGYLYFDTLSDYQEGFKEHGKTILDDIPNYTNIKPTVQISKVIK